MLWEKLSGDPGVLALSSDFVEEKRLPYALRFPWDKDKGFYLLQSFHNLHCLVCLPSRLPVAVGRFFDDSTHPENVEDVVSLYHVR
jgi:hypothetical protein